MNELDKSRKDDHVNRALEYYKENEISDFDSVDFIHHVLPEVNFEDVDISTSFAGFDFSNPFHINGMTGGSDFTKVFNRKLAIIARETNIFMAVGSLSVALRDKSTHASYKVVRKENPNGIIFANLGADKTLEDAKRACEIIDADGIQIHINACQEIVMPEGERDFSKWSENISNIIENLGLPVLIKEVGNGMSKQSIQHLINLGAKTIDISGKGGTNFAKIENSRRKNNEYNFLENFGNSTVNSMLEAQEFIHDYDIIASGGIRNSMDIVKSLSLGAKSVAMAGRFIYLVNETPLEEAIEMVNNWKYEIKSIMTLLGASKLSDLSETDLIIRNQVKDWCEIRGIDFKKFGNRFNKL